MRLVYVANVRLPTEKAHGVQIMKMCEAFARLGHEVELIVPTRQNAIVEDPFVYYGVSPTFTLTYINVPDTSTKGRLGFIFAAIVFGFRVRTRLSTAHPDLIYSRDELPLLIVARRRFVPVLWESHTGSWNVAVRRLITRCKKVVTISGGLKEFYVEHGVSENKIVVAHDAISLADFEQVESQAAAHTRLGLPNDRTIVMYAGRLDGWKGVDTLLEASKLFSARILLAVIGGTAEEIERLSNSYPKVRFLGYKPYRELPDNLSAADVLVLPNTGAQEVSVRYTSPLKLFAYMASGRPIIASDLPSIREVLDEESAVLVPADDAVALSKGIEGLCVDDALGRKLAERARELVTHYTWEERAERILSARTTTV